MSLIDKIEELKAEYAPKIAKTDAIKEIEEIRVNLFGKKGAMTQILKGMKEISADQRQEVGKFVNTVRDEISEVLEQRKAEIQKELLEQKLRDETIDVTMPGSYRKPGTRHVLQQIIEEIEDHFVGLGYQILEGPEVETDRYNFEMMNLPADHPARDMQDTFYITPDVLMRTQTSPMQARAMEKHDFSKGPLKMISPGKVYRRDTDDATHSHQFHQVEGLVIGENITMADLKGTLLSISQKLFGDRHNIRLRPSYFPFTEPSVEVDVSWNEVTEDMDAADIDWIEVLGAGMVHPNVLEMAGVDSTRYSGFAFGLGPDRFAMLKYGVEDIRQFYLNDVRFLEQFNRKAY